jgi:exonuclease SbcD
MRDYNQRVRSFLEGAARRFIPGTANIVASHLYVDGGSGCESERQIQVGGAYTVDVASFPPESTYVGLGHLHREQEMRGRDDIPVRYAGSVLQYSFSEAGQKKAVTIVEFDRGGMTYRSVPLAAGRSLRQIRAENGVEDLERQLAGCDPGEWVTVSLLLDDPLPSEYLINIRKAHPNILHCIPSYRPKPGDPDGVSVSIASLPLREQFRRFVETRFQEPPGDEVMRLFLELAVEEEEENETPRHEGTKEEGKRGRGVYDPIVEISNSY